MCQTNSNYTEEEGKAIGVFQLIFQNVSDKHAFGLHQK